MENDIILKHHDMIAFNTHTLEVTDYFTGEIFNLNDSNMKLREKAEIVSAIKGMYDNESSRCKDRILAWKIRKDKIDDKLLQIKTYLKERMLEEQVKNISTKDYTVFLTERIYPDLSDIPTTHTKFTVELPNENKQGFIDVFHAYITDQTDITKVDKTDSTIPTKCNYSINFRDKTK